MLSIIISSYQPEYFQNLSENIRQTIGQDFEYEIIQIQNPNSMGICEAYNKGAAQAKFDNLLFLHEDVEFETQNWGNILGEYFTNNEIGAIGVAGNNYIPNVPFAWWDSFENDFRNMQQYKKKEFLRTYKLEQDHKVYSLDGVFLACTKKTFEQFPFDENIKGFHCYDLNFSVRIANQFQNMVTSKIMLRHFSEGTKNKEWFINLIRYRKTFQKPEAQIINKKKEAYFFIKYIEYLKDFDFTKTEHRKLLVPYISPKFIGWKLALKTISKLI